MIKTWSVILGIGLVILWIAGLSAVNSTPWLTWLDGAGAVYAFFMAGSVGDLSPRGARVGSTIVLSLGLFALWIIALATNQTPWQSWWTFAFACAFLVLAIATGASRPIAARQADIEQSRTHDRFRRSA